MEAVLQAEVEVAVEAGAGERMGEVVLIILLVLQFVTGSFQISLVGYSASHPVFSLQEDRVSVNSHFEDIDLPGLLVFKPVSYFKAAWF